MVSIPIEWRLGIKGSDEVKSELDQLSAAFNRAKASGMGHRKEQTALSNAVGRRLREDQLQNRLLLAQHPLLLKSMRALSTITSITRGLLTISNALNISKIQGNQVDEIAAGHLSKANEFMRTYKNLVAEGKGNTDEARLALENYNTEMALHNQRIQDVKDSNFNEVFTAITSAIFAGSSAFMAFGKHLKDIVVFFGGAAGILKGSVFVALALAIGQAAEQLYKFLFGVEDMDKWREQNVAALINFFTVSIPTAIGSAGVALTQFFMDDLPLWAGIGLESLIQLFKNTWNSIISTTNFGVNSVISGINSIVDGAISAINSFISAINSILRKAKLGTIPLIPKFKGIPPINIPMIAAAKGFNGMVTQPTMFLAGEAGPEQVTISPNRQGSGGNTIIVNVAGSVVTEKKIAYMVDQYQKQNLKSRGFTGFG